MPKHNIYTIPRAGEAREQLREKGQFWTPAWVAEAMVDYVLDGKHGMLFDPAVGAGAFFRAAKTVAHEKGLSVTLSGMDIDPTVVTQACQQGLTPDDVSRVSIGDFIFEHPQKKQSAIVANPPYIRHHRIPATTKERLKQVSLQTIGKVLDGRAGLHSYFFLRALTLLEEHGRLAFIMSADTCEGKYAPDLWRWVTAHFALDAVIVFAPHATPFPHVDTNPLIFLIRKATPTESFFWVTCHEPQTDLLKVWVGSGFANSSTQGLHGLTVVQRTLSEGLRTGLSRPMPAKKSSIYTLGDFVHIVRGVATGANTFFFMTAEQVKQTGIPDNYFIRAIGRTRDVPSDEVTQATLEALEAKGRPTFLLTLNGDAFESYPESLRNYLRKGVALGLPQKALISQRKPWYRMESRIAPPFLFAYLGRRHTRFIRNTAKVVPLTGFLCVYPKVDDNDNHDRLWHMLNHPDTIANLVLVGKSYGDGAVKVEPRALETLPIPEHVIKQGSIKKTQMRLLENGTPYKL